VGFDLTYWPENQNQAFRSATIPVHDVHDRCLGLPEDEEYEINSRLNGYLVESSKGRVEIIAMDYFEEPVELVSNVIEMD
jgi:hypothetical protein